MDDSTALTVITVDLVPASPLPADQHPALVYLASLAPGSRRTMRGALDTIARMVSNDTQTIFTFNWAALRYQHTTAIRSMLAEQYEPATANKMLAALRRVLLEARRLKLMTPDDYADAADVASIKASTLVRGRAITPGELRALLTACAADHTAAGARDAAIVSILIRSGLRRSEAVALDVADYDTEEGKITVRQGKGRKDRTTYLDGMAAQAVEDWLRMRGHEAGPLLCPVNKAGRIDQRRLSDQAIRRALQKRAEEAKVAPFTPHDMRRTFVSELLDAGADIVTAQKLAGHANPATTSRYDRRGEATKRKATTLLHFPYTPRKGE